MITISPYPISVLPTRMSMLSPAERAIRITLSGPSSRICARVITRRPNSTSTSSGTSAKSAICSSGLIAEPASLDQLDRGLTQFVHRVDDLRIRFVPTLIDDQVRKFNRNVDRRRFNRSALHGASAAGTGESNRG